MHRPEFISHTSPGQHADGPGQQSSSCRQLPPLLLPLPPLLLPPLLPLPPLLLLPPPSYGCLESGVASEEPASPPSPASADWSPPISA
jgi:hypothetical protein